MFEHLPYLANLATSALVIGIGATAVMDIWALFLKVVFHIPSLNYALVGRWLGHLTNGQIVHQNIGSSPVVKGEMMIGWIAHYVIGVIFAAALLLIVGLPWSRSPDIIPALMTGVITVGFPFLVMQPCFGMGVAASKLDNSHIAQFKSLLTHTVFGIGLYISALAGQFIF